MKFIAIILVGLLMIGAAVWMAFNDKEGWGWFLFLGVLLVGSQTDFVNDK